MNALGEWLKQLVLIVLLAAFADLLLPTKAMQKYVRMVMGLAIIAAMLQPIMPLLQRDWADQAAHLAANEVFSNTAGANTDGTGFSGSNATVGPFKQELTQQTDNTADKLLARQLTEEITTTYRVSVKAMKVTGLGAGQQQLRVVVELSPATHQQQAAIAHHLATELGISQGQVSVSAG